MEKEYTITVTETLSLSVPVLASSEEEAKSIVEKNWKKGDLLVEHLESVSFKAFKAE